MLPAPYWRSADGKHTIYHADCRDVLTGLLPGSVDAVVTDPPWEIETNSDFKRGSVLVHLGREDFNTNSDMAPWEWVSSTDYLRRGGNLACFHKNEDHVPPPFVRSQSFYLVKRDPPPTPRSNFSSGVSTCSICYIPGGKRTWNGGASTPNYLLVTTSEFILQGGEHRSPKPLRAILLLVRCLSNPGDLVLDPFLGSGTTSVACVQTGRRSIGIEQNERYCEIAVRRLERTLAQPVLFLPERITDAQESLELTG